MKILHVLDHSVPLHSGYTFRTLAILNQQRELGWQTEHVTSAKHTLDSDPVEEVDGYRFFRTPASHKWWHRLPGMSQFAIVLDLARRIEEVVDEVNPDIIHAHSPALNGLAALRVAKARNIPLVYECRAFWEDAAVNHGTCKPKSIRYRVTRALETYVFRKADAVTTICEGLRKDIIERGVDPSKITVIPNAVDTEKFICTDDKPQDIVEKLNLNSSVVLGFFGSFYEYEGLAFLLRAMPEIIKRHSSITLLLVGGGPEESLIKDLVDEKGLSDNVIMVGRVPHAVIQDYYQVVDVMIYPRLPMRLTDLVTPLKPLEAMAKGKLVLASDVGGHKELIEHGETGFLFKAGDTQDLVDMLDLAVAKQNEWPAMKENGRNFVVEDRNWARSVSFYKDVYGRSVG